MKKALAMTANKWPKLKKALTGSMTAKRKNKKFKQTKDNAQWPKLKKAHLKEIDTI